jgi:phosphoribosylformylglycinamidine synthase subunit PurS
MNATVIVTLKPTVLDPQGLTIHRSLGAMGLAGVDAIRQGKYFEVEVSDALSQADRQQVVEQLAREVLTNPVIETFRIVWP